MTEVWATKQHVVRLGVATDHAREAWLANSAIDAGVRTARAVAWGDGYSIWQRLPGKSVSESRCVSDSVWNELLDDLERLHRRPPEPRPCTAQKDERLHGIGLIELSRERARWTKSEVESLTKLLGEPRQHRLVFVHGDAYAGNVLVDKQGSYVALIDWGCAGWGSLEAECARLEDGALEVAKQRWVDQLDLGLLELLRLDLLIEVLVRGRVGADAVREQLVIAAQYN